jgi:hypothetical protein
MVKNENEHSEKSRAKQGCPAISPEPYKIRASTPFDFGAKNLTPYGGHADAPIMPTPSGRWVLGGGRMAC